MQVNERLWCKVEIRREWKRFGGCQLGVLRHAGVVNGCDERRRRWIYFAQRVSIGCYRFLVAHRRLYSGNARQETPSKRLPPWAPNYSERFCNGRYSSECVDDGRCSADAPSFVKRHPTPNLQVLRSNRSSEIDCCVALHTFAPSHTYQCNIQVCSFIT